MHSSRLIASAPGVVLGALAACSLILAAPPFRPGTGRPTLVEPDLRVDASLVLVSVTVEDGRNRPVTSLDKSNFRIYDDEVEQSITAFSKEDDAAAVGLILDTSGSMRWSLPAARQAANEFLKLANPQDEFFLVEFDSAPRLMIPLTPDAATIEAEIARSSANGYTALVDSLDLAVREMRRSSKPKKALVLFSDGGENHSRYTRREIRNLAREGDVLIYTVAIGPAFRNTEQRSGLGLMGRIAETTGGRTYDAPASELPGIARQIALELRNRYVLGFSPRNPARDGHYHRLRVQLVPPAGRTRMRARWRRGYYAPSE